MSDYIITRADGDDLQHFGTKGMKWGERRYQNEDGSLTALGRQRYGVGGERSAFRTKLDLNKLDREQTNARARQDYYSAKSIRSIAKAKKKLRKANASGDSEKIAKAKERLTNAQNSKATKKAAEYKALLERSEAMTKKIIEVSKKKGYSIHSRDVLRDVNRGHSIAGSLLATTGAVGVTMLTGVVTGPIGFDEYAVGKHYRVKNDGLGTQTHRSRRFSFEPHITR